jgi:hypothetical protein
MQQKIIQVGNSLAVTIPKKFLETIQVPEDGLVSVVQDEKSGKIILDFMTPQDIAKEIIDPEVYPVAKDLLKRYLPAFKELAKK